MRHDRALWEECVRTAEEAGLPLLVDGVGDVEYPVAARNAYILRIGGYRFLPEKGRIQVPPPSDDLLERVCGGQLRIRGGAVLRVLRAAQTVMASDRAMKIRNQLMVMVLG